MLKNTLGKIYCIIFGIIFIVMVGIMIKGYIDQQHDDEQQIVRYESLKSGEGRTLLTGEILEEDHDKYIRDVREGETTFIKLAICFGVVVAFFVIYSILNMVIRGIEGERGPMFTISIVSTVSALVIITGVVIVVIKVIAPKFSEYDPESEAYSFAELNLTDSEKKVEYVDSYNGDSKTTEERITYYLIEENGHKTEVNFILYGRYEGPGVYYAGRTSGGNIFSLYPGKYFELEK